MTDGRGGYYSLRLFKMPEKIIEDIVDEGLDQIFPNLFFGAH